MQPPTEKDQKGGWSVVFNAIFNNISVIFSQPHNQWRQTNALYSTFTFHTEFVQLMRFSKSTVEE
jgi:hypothetical protein